MYHPPTHPRGKARQLQDCQLQDLELYSYQIGNKVRISKSPQKLKELMLMWSKHHPRKHPRGLP